MTRIGTEQSILICFIRVYLRPNFFDFATIKVFMSNSEPNKIIFSMVKVSKFYDKKPVLKDIYLSFFYGAKIGVLGLNGAGKSSLLRIIAGTDKDFNGEVVF